MAQANRKAGKVLDRFMRVVLPPPTGGPDRAAQRHTRGAVSKHRDSYVFDPTGEARRVEFSHTKPNPKVAFGRNKKRHHRGYHERRSAVR
jgi:hypothetical protein